MSKPGHSGIVMADYWGLPSIAEKLGCNPLTVLSKIKRESFPAYLTRKFRSKHPRLVYYTNDEMILSWHLARAREQRVRRYGQVLKDHRDRHRPGYSGYSDDGHPDGYSDRSIPSEETKIPREDNPSQSSSSSISPMKNDDD